MAGAMVGAEPKTGHLRPIWCTVPFPEVRNEQTMHVCFSPDGKKVAVCNNSNMARILSADTGSVMLTLQTYHDSVCSVKFSPDGRILACGCSEDNVVLWDARSGRQLRILEGLNWRGSSIVDMAFSEDGTQVAALAEEGSYSIYHIDGDLIYEQIYERGAPICHGVSISFWGSSLLVCKDDSIDLYEGPSYTRSDFVSERWDNMTTLSVSKDAKGDYYALAVGHGQVWVWRRDAKSGRPVLLQHITIIVKEDTHGFLMDEDEDEDEDSLLEYENLESPCNGLLILSRGLIVVSNYCSQVQFWCLEAGTLLAQIGGYGVGYTWISMAIDPSGTELVTGNDDGTVVKAHI